MGFHANTCCWWLVVSEYQKRHISKAGISGTLVTSKIHQSCRCRQADWILTNAPSNSDSPTSANSLPLDDTNVIVMLDYGNASKVHFVNVAPI